MSINPSILKDGVLVMVKDNMSFILQNPDVPDPTNNPSFCVSTIYDDAGDPISASWSWVKPGVWVKYAEEDKL